MLKNTFSWLNRTSILFILILMLAAILRFIDLDSAPAGGHGDVAWIGINALDWTDRGIWPYYIRELYSPEPVIVYLTGLTIPLVGVSYLAPRLVTAIFGVLLVAFLFPAIWWLLEDVSLEFRKRASLLASLAAAVSLHWMFLSRLGMESPLSPAAVAVLLWLTAWAWRRGGWQRWALAGAALAFTQYLFLPSRLLPVVVGLWLAHGWLSDRSRFRAQWRGILVMASVAFILTSPNIILFLTTPRAFSARADIGSATTGGWIWKYDTSAQGGLLSVLLQKFGLMLLAFGIWWNGSYTIMNQPMLGAAFFLGLLLSLGALLRWPKRIAYAWPVLAIPIMLVPDLISGATVKTNALHQIGVLPFAFVLAGVGLAHLQETLNRRIRPQQVRFAVTIGIVAATILPSLWGTYRYLANIIPSQYADRSTGVRLEQTDVDISQQILEQPDRAYLLPYEEYSRSNVAWLVSNVFRDRLSPIDSAGLFNLPALPDQLTVVMPTNPFRIRHDGSLSQFDTRLWVLLEGNQTWLLPPLTVAQETELLDLLKKYTPEVLLDRSNTQIATLYSGQLPDDLFVSRPIIDHPLDATFDNRIQLLGYNMRSQDLEPNIVTFVTLYWRAIDRAPDQDYNIFVQILNDAGKVIGGTNDFPYEGMYRTRIWRPTEIVATHHWFITSRDLPPGRYTLIAGLTPFLSSDRVPASGADVDSDGRTIRVPDLRRPLPQPSNFGAPLTPTVRFDNLFNMAGIDIALDGVPQLVRDKWTVKAGQTLDISLTWGVTARPPLDYSIFLHLSPSENQQLVAQSDQALGGTFPSGAWRPGDNIKDHLALTLPADLKSGEYSLWFGVYFWQTGERLPVWFGNDPQPNNQIWLSSIVVP
jgi:hypothetical protein